MVMVVVVMMMRGKSYVKAKDAMSPERHSEGWRGDSEVESTGYSSRRPRFDSLYPKGSSELFITPVSENEPPSSSPLRPCMHVCTDIHAGKTPIQIK